MVQDDRECKSLENPLEARLLHVLRGTFNVVISTRPLIYYIYEWHCTAVMTRSLSEGSCFPPGKAVCPGCVLKCLDLVVRSTRSSSSCSYKSTRTAPSFACGWKGLVVYPHKKFCLYYQKQVNNSEWRTNLRAPRSRDNRSSYWCKF